MPHHLTEDDIRANIEVVEDTMLKDMIEKEKVTKTEVHEIFSNGTTTKEIRW